MSAPPTGLDAAALRRAAAPLGEAFDLPGEAYTSEDVLAWEQQVMFAGSWVCVGRADAVSEPGSRRSVRIGDEGVLLVRGDDGKLRAFFNVCRHRGHEVVEAGEHAPARTLQCPYHGWIYNLDGTLRGAPGFRDVPAFDRSDHTLTPVRSAERHGWVFVNASGDASEFDQHAGDLEDLVKDHEPERLTVAASHEYVVRANWKVVTSNYHECYHCSNIHPQLCRVTPTDSGLNLDPAGAWVGGPMDLMEHAQTMSLSGESRGVPLRGLDERERRQVFYLNLFPNLLISLHPDYVLTHRLEPLSPSSTRVECEWLFPPEALELDGFDPKYAVEFWDITNRQDWHACESVQRGVSSRGFRPGPLSLREDASHQFLALVARSYLEGRVAAPTKVAAPATSGEGR
ncbi:MAG TPA: aromatic ring-hydroxylating dioxygenase subunit alpha [Acidimicrobiales bacterium]|nr:aromatic ring-hydroxylating dioxygenase subunit alpha [Acidimicrobiales bacterium]